MLSNYGISGTDQNPHQNHKPFHNQDHSFYFQKAVFFSLGTVTLQYASIFMKLKRDKFGEERKNNDET